MGIMEHERAVRRPRRMIIISVISLLAVILFVHSVQPDTTSHVKSYITHVSSSISEHAKTTFKSKPASKEGRSIEEILKFVYEPLKIDITAPVFIDSNSGERLRLPGKPTWTKPLGKRICFVDIDTRHFDGDWELLTLEPDENGQKRIPKPFDFDRLGGYPAGMLAHYAYTQIHGYDYKFIRTNDYEDRAAYWTKPGAVASLLADYDFVISIDADATIAHPELPFEWLLNRWRITPTTAISIAREPGNPRDYDENHRLMDNGGFVVAQNIPRAFEILNAWTACPDEPSEHYEGCANWKRPFPAEQFAFSQYISTAFNETGDINEIECDDANGSWGFEASEDFPVFCKGRFISHFTLTKGLLKEGLGRIWAGGIFERLHQQFNRDREERVVLRETNVFPGYEGQE